MKFRHPIDDPFVVTRVTIGWLDRLKSLFSKDFYVTIRVDEVMSSINGQD